MTEIQEWFEKAQVERTMKALRKNNFDASFVPRAKDAAKEVFTMIPDNATVGVGGSVTLTEIGFFEEAATHPVKLLNPSPTPSIEDFMRARREMFLADVYVCSSNAVTEDGKLYNIDGSGNRVGSMTFGPRNVILVCGINKIVRDLDEALRRVQHRAAPMNARRLGLKTPCAETGVCADCASPERICNTYVLSTKKPLRTNVTVLLVGEPLGL